ncbi:LGFP repeat-containing protein [Kineococcus sp. NUM-3379]
MGTLLEKAAGSLVERASALLAARTDRRGFLARTAVVGSAVAVSPVGFLTRPVSAYAAVCGIDSTCSSGYTAFCATINGGVNRCPPGSLVGGWWKSDGSGFCCGNARYYIDCHSYCKCGCGGRSNFCGEGCRDCSCGCGPKGQCDQRKVCCNEFRYGQCNQDVRCTGPVWCRVVTCTPPWRIPSWKCSTTVAVDQRTNAHSAPSLQDCTAIGVKHTALGGPGSFLGEQVTPERSTPGGAGVFQHFDGGSVYWSRATGAHEVHGAVRGTYERLGWEAGPLGFPTTDELRTPDGRGRFNHFSGSGGASVYWTRETGAHAVWGAVRDTWERLGWETGPLGYPVTSELRTPDGRGRFNHFSGSDGSSVYWSPETGAHAVHGRIRDLWERLGWEAGPLGYPVTDELDAPGGRARFNDFDGSGGSSVYWSRATGAVSVSGPIRRAWLDAQGPVGALGLPREEAAPDGPGRVRQVFEGGTAVLDTATGQVTLTPA